MTFCRRLGAAMLALLCLSLLCMLPALAEGEEPVLTLSEHSIVIDLAVSAKGGTLVPTLSPEVEKPRFQFTTSDGNIARVGSNGAVTGRKVGTCTITATLRGTNASDTCTVIVKDSRIPESITLKEGTAVTLERYETFQLTPNVQPAFADQRIKWSSSASSVASVNKNGLVTAKKGGTAVITCYSYRSKEVCAQFTVTVNQYPSPTSISLAHEPTYMVIGSTLQLTPVTEPAGVQVCSFYTWSASPSRVASVSPTGLVTANRTGFVTITCRSKQDSRKRAQLKILVVEPDSPYYITLTPSADTITLNPTDVITIGHSVFPAGRSQAVTYKSSRSSVASVDQNGVVTVKKAGTAKITVTSAVNKLVTAVLTINSVNLPAPDSITLDPRPMTMEINSTLQLTPTTYPIGEKRSQEFRWKTSSSSIARVSDTGLVTARKLGTVTITCYSARNSRVKETLTIRVIDSNLPDSVTLDAGAAITLEDSQKIQLTPTVVPSTAIQTVTWRSSNTRVASVDSDGVVTAYRAGSAYIYATSTYSSARFARIKVIVTTKPAPASLTFPTGTASIYVGKSAQITVSPNPANASVLAYYSSSNTAVATVDNNGVITTHKVGTAVITARSIKNSATASMVVAVYDDYTPGAVNLSANTLYLGVGSDKALSASVFPATADQTITWSSENPHVATVDSTGKVHAAAIGSTNIVAKASNGVENRCRVCVTLVNVASTVPARITLIGEIPQNMAKIAAIKSSSMDTIASLQATGTISASEASERSAIIKRAFAMQEFPWMTLNTQEYWTSKYAEKRYLPGKVYYGLPYTQQGANGNTKNRTYNVEKILSENRWYDSHSGYYVLNQKNLLNGSYAGCDCSSFVNMATFGINHPAAFLRTFNMNTSAYYKTLGSYSELRPGDHLVLAKSHTVMFLYWMDAEKTKFMIIEQGGDGSCVICSIKDASFYASQNYIPRRVKTFG